jgi:hypothetical protein
MASSNQFKPAITVQIERNKILFHGNWNFPPQPPNKKRIKLYLKACNTW